MHQERVQCPQCTLPGKDFYKWNCPRCNGTRFIMQPRLFDPNKAPSGFQRLPQFLVTAAFILLCLAYCANIQQRTHNRYGLNAIMPDRYFS
jgi:hypothetical protein